jgi:uncharacterized membrane protein YwaF
MTTTEMWDLALLVLMLHTFMGVAYLLVTTEPGSTVDDPVDEWP